MKRHLVIAWLALGAVWGAHAAEVSVAVASNFTVPMKKIAAAFERDTGHRARLSFASTGRLYAQIRHGAPFDVLLAADDQIPAQLVAQGQALASSRFTYAIGQLVLWSPQPGVVDAEGQVLRRGGFDRLALADPKLAPYGAAAVEALTRLGVWAAWQPKAVYGENIAQTQQFVATQNAPLGFVALSQVFAEGRLTEGSAWVVPTRLYAPIRQDAVLLRRAEHHTAALALLRYLQGPAARALIQGHGYTL